jgi:acetyl-CoA carboxylase carboxyltransferase component
MRRVATSDPVARFCPEEDLVLRRAFGTAAGFNAPLDVTNFLQQIVDYGDYFELQPQRARNLVTAFGRIGGHTVGFFCNNSAVSSGQIDIAAAGKGTRFVRFCNLYNIPMVFLEDTTGFLPGTDQETGGIVSAGRRLLDSIIDLRTPRITVILRNAFGGAYATVNSHYIGADLVLALPTARVAVMGKAGVQYVYKNEVAAIAREHAEAIKAGASAQEADARRAEAMAALGARYEEELMNPKEALALGSVNRIVMPGSVRSTLAENLDFFMSRYNPSPMGGPQREYE